MAKKNIATFLGPQSGLSIIGKHAYAYSSAFPANVSSITALEFTTGNEYIVGKFNLNSAVQFDSANIAGTFIQIKLNGEQVAIGFSGNGANDSPSSLIIKILLPPHTHVVVNGWADNDAGASYANIQFVGDVYE